MGVVSIHEDEMDRRNSDTFGKHISSRSEADKKSHWSNNIVDAYSALAEERDKQAKASERAKFWKALKSTGSLFAAHSVLKPSPREARLKAVIARRPAIR